jgi:N-acetylneuraminic acid mutarotase
VSLIQGSQPGWNSFAIGDGGLVVGPISGTPVTTFDGTETFSVSLEAMSPFFDLVGEKIDGYSPITVNVPIPEGYIKPEGEVEITENGPVDVTQYESVVVNVPSKEPKLDILEVTENGTYKASDASGDHISITFNQDHPELGVYVNGWKGLQIEANIPALSIVDGNADITPLQSGWTYALTIGNDPTVNVNPTDENLMYACGAFGVAGLVTVGMDNLPIFAFSPSNIEEIALAGGATSEELTNVLAMYPPNTITLYDLSSFSLPPYEITFTYETAGEPIDGFSEVVVNVPAVGFYTTEENESGGLTYRFSAEKSDVVEFNIAYGDTEPTDTSKLWVKTIKPSVVKVSSDVNMVESDNSSCVTVSGSLDLNGAGVVQVGNYVYAFGGNNTNIIQKYNTADNSKVTLGTTLPQASNHLSAVCVGTTIYLFGRGYSTTCYDTIWRFDVEPETITTLNTKLPTTLSNSCGWAYGNKIYLFGGETEYYVFTNSIYCFDVETETVTTLNATLPEVMRNLGGILYNKTIYLFGGWKKWILKFDCETQTLTASSTSLLYEANFVSCSIINDYIFLFGAHRYEEALAKNIYKFDPSNESLTTCNVTMPHIKRLGAFAAKVTENTVQILGGYYNSSNSKDVFLFTYGEDLVLSSDTLQIVPTPDKNIFNLINTDNMQVEIGVMSVLKGNADGIGEQVEAALHNGTSWVTI